MPNLETRVHTLEATVGGIREKMASVETEQRHILDTCQRIDACLQDVNKKVDRIPDATKLFSDPRFILILVTLFGGALGIDTMAYSLANPSVAAPAPPLVQP